LENLFTSSAENEKNLAKKLQHSINSFYENFINNRRNNLFLDLKSLSLTMEMEQIILDHGFKLEVTPVMKSTINKGFHARYKVSCIDSSQKLIIPEKLIIQKFEIFKANNNRITPNKIQTIYNLNEAQVCVLLRGYDYNKGKRVLNAKTEEYGIIESYNTGSEASNQYNITRYKVKLDNGQLSTWNEENTLILNMKDKFLLKRR